ncbi:MAG: SAM-dependent methyltransferase [Acidobacteria bacterium RIFCSPLOWO2_02_FULL_64_15]|nr:MAG: SAM-dependent methyltransferase [Acidobacteria bacterium RIFCSPLOWO2_02_FULL_64_15]
MNRKAHWDRIYASKTAEDVSWFQLTPATSLRLLEAANVGLSSCAIDIGGGDSRLVDHLLAKGLTCLTVLDVSAAALARVKARLGPRQQIVNWVEADVTLDWSVPPVDVWHDRAVFHFLTDAVDRTAYVARLKEIVKPGGAVIVATFALDGPEKCSGLPVMRYSAEGLAAELGPGFTLLETVNEDHRTPAGVRQAFCYTRFRRSGNIEA